MTGRTPLPRRGTGSIVWFNAKLGYGFMKPDAGGPDLFVRVPNRTIELRSGQRVDILVTASIPPRTEAIIDAKI
ncbi:cold shock domain-containing protein [Nitrobacter sp.]|uniref:cold-shock protein n=1 Tax=Nitrobacter sp. TaxID=29420 RepID=UPI0029CAAF97|nr:cold shock domain-containing protein [Nitrobacter sp.]